MFGSVILIYVKCTKLAEFIFFTPSQKLFDHWIFFKIMHQNSSSFKWLKIKFFIPLLNPIFKCVPGTNFRYCKKSPQYEITRYFDKRRAISDLIKTTKKAISKGFSYTGQETGVRRRETGDGRQATGDRRRETGDGRQATGDRRRETGDRRQATGDRRRETGDGRQATGDRQRETGERQAADRWKTRDGRQAGGRQT